MTMANPPAVAQILLPLLVRVDAREAVSGDLLEEYREARLPRLGRRRADFWYWRQVGGIWLRAYWWLAVPIVLALGIHDVFNTFRAPSGASYLDGLPALARVVISPLAGVAVFALAGAYGSWRTRQWEGGVVAALGTFCVTWLFMLGWWNATFYPFAQVQQSNPYWIEAWQWSTQRAHSDATFLRWIFWDNVGSLIIGGIAMLTASVVCGGFGSGLGLLAARRR
jgi:hypothetical protein